MEGVSVKCSVLLARGYKEQNNPEQCVRGGSRQQRNTLGAFKLRKSESKISSSRPKKSEVICRVKLGRIRGATGFTLTATKLYRRGRNSSLKR